MGTRGTDQVSFTLSPPSLRAFVARIAEEDGRTLSGLLRLWIAERAKAAGWTNGASAPWPPPLTEPGESIETTRTRLAALIEERDRLVARDQKQRWTFSLQDEERLHRVRNMIDSLEPIVRLADRMMAPDSRSET
jgi:hypothetical protein